MTTGADDLRPVAPHLDPRVAHLTNVAPARRRWFGRGRRPAELPRNASSDALGRRIETPRRISVVGLKGGVGKTTSAILLARTIARGRPEPVLLLDSDTTYGSLLLRLGTPPVASAHDIAAMGDPGTLAVLRGMVARTDDGVWVVPSGRNPAQSAAFDEQTYVAAVRALYRYFPVSITDCGTGIAGSLMRRVVEASHALVIATSASVDGVLSAHNALEWLISTGHDDLARRSIVVVGNVGQQPSIDVEETKRGLEQICRTVVCVPADPAIATGGYLDFAQLQPETRQAAQDLASLALDSAFRGGA
ncbi:MinD/ParA family ATP-binding protein [Cumulibacter manganitolerans]|uniref:MinD/ParA family ATP-binding protein n=1 Tax=Cumulibacter manganitolerans TaxID=1884992 RepID=UPI0012967F31|nr:MinD/ParA family protein [Cumulibacter manganitolerans]